MNQSVPDPFKIAKVGVYLSPLVSPRISAQGALFTIHPEPSRPFDSPSLAKIIITGKCKHEIRRKLLSYDITYG
jgi:hypothetical protein